MTTNNNHISSPPKFFTSVSKAFSHKQPDDVLTLAPSILSADFANLATDLKKMLRGKCYWAHLDVMDGHFVPNITFGPPAVASIRKVSTRLFLDTHLMISDPLQYIDAFADAGSDLITFHAETVAHTDQAIRAIRKRNLMAGITIKPKTSVNEIEACLDKIDMVLVMTVEPGFGGQELKPTCLNKVRQLARIREEKGLSFLIQVDGGINLKTAGLAVAAGANVLVAGSAVFGSGNIQHNMAGLRDQALKMGV